jgi:hypothetical protein
MEHIDTTPELARTNSVSQEPPASPEKRANATWLLLVLLVAAIAFAFSPAYHASFVDLDDRSYVFDNPLVVHGLSFQSIKYALTSRADGMWIPLTRLSLVLDGEISQMIYGEHFGTGLPPAAVYHVHNVILHALSACMLFCFFNRATRLRWQSFAIALLWAIHPLRVESVAWVTERKDVLSGLWGFTSLYCYILWREKPGVPWYAATVISLAMSLLAKATFISLPFLMLIIDYWPLKRWNHLRDLGRLVMEKLPLFVIAIGHAMLASYVARRLTVHDLPHAENALVNLGRYVWMEFDVRHLAPFYPYAPPAPGTVAAVGLAIAAITLLILFLRRRWPAVAAGWMWYLVACVPVAGAVQAFSQGYADRFTYLPAVGLISLLVFAIPHALFRGRRLVIPLIGLGLIAALLIGMTYRQSQYWQNSFTLFSHSRDVTPPNELVHRTMGSAYWREGKMDDALRELSTAVQIDPNSVDAQLAFAQVNLATEHLDEAIAAAEEVIRLSQGSQTGPAMRADAYLVEGVACMRQGRKQDAIERFEAALKEVPGHEKARAALDEAMNR